MTRSQRRQGVRYYFRALLQERFTSLTRASQAAQISYQRLSRFISGAIELTDDEMLALRRTLQVSKRRLQELIRK